mgnify:CR=1 FL=1
MLGRALGSETPLDASACCLGAPILDLFRDTLRFSDFCWPMHLFFFVSMSMSMSMSVCVLQCLHRMCHVGVAGWMMIYE